MANTCHDSVCHPRMAFLLLRISAGTKKWKLSEIMNEQIITELQHFWNEIRDKELYHGTSTFFLDHVKQKGFGGSMPFHEDFMRIIRFYSKYKKFAKDPYFNWFIDRLGSEVSHIFFTNDRRVAEQEFARGARKGGEWLRSLSSFIYFLEEAEHYHQITLSQEDHQEKEFLKRFMAIAHTHKGMLITLKISSPYLDEEMNMIGPYLRLGSFHGFRDHILRISDSDIHVLKQKVFPAILRSINTPNYEFHLRIKRPIPIQELKITFFD